MTRGSQLLTIGLIKIVFEHDERMNELFDFRQVFARFFAEDHDSGRVSYFLSRKTYLLITDLVRKVMRVQDPRVLSLRQDYVEGLKPGRTELQVCITVCGEIGWHSNPRVGGSSRGF